MGMIVARIQAAQEVTGVALGLALPFLEGFLFHPATRRLPGAPGVGQARFNRANGGVDVFAILKPSVAVFALV
jgi:hypothetical protein